MNRVSAVSVQLQKEFSSKKKPIQRGRLILPLQDFREDLPPHRIVILVKEPDAGPWKEEPPNTILLYMPLGATLLFLVRLGVCQAVP
jgi:hypothetical protein